MKDTILHLMDSLKSKKKKKIVENGNKVQFGF